MKNKSGEAHFYVGHCNQCGEVFESQSKTDDLEGIVFKCQKVMCSGKVSLHHSKHSTSPKKSSSVVSTPSSIKSKTETPRRYC